MGPALNSGVPLRHAPTRNMSPLGRLPVYAMDDINNGSENDLLLSLDARARGFTLTSSSSSSSSSGGGTPKGDSLCISQNHSSNSSGGGSNGKRRALDKKPCFPWPARLVPPFNMAAASHSAAAAAPPHHHNKISASPSSHSLQPAYLDAIDTMDEHNRTLDAGDAGGIHHEDGSGGAGGDDMSFNPRRPSRANTRMSVMSRKRSSTHILESKIPKMFRGDLPTADDVTMDLEANKGHGGRGDGHHFAARSQSKYDVDRVHAALHSRLEVKNLLVAGVSEFAGTFLFLFFALAINTTVANVKDAEKAAGNNGTDLTALLVSSLGFGFSLA